MSEQQTLPVTVSVYRELQNKKDRFEGFAHHTKTRPISYVKSKQQKLGNGKERKLKQPGINFNPRERKQLTDDVLTEFEEILKLYKKKGYKPYGEVIFA